MIRKRTHGPGTRGRDTTKRRHSVNPPQYTCCTMNDGIVKSAHHLHFESAPCLRCSAVLSTVVAFPHWRHEFERIPHVVH